MHVTGDQVKAFWKYMSKKYGFQIVQKDNAVAMQIVGWALEQMDIQDQDEFLSRYSTTVCLGDFKAVYIPFEIGKGNQAQLIAQILTCVHETEHVLQAKRDPLQPVKYLQSDANRAFYEADAYRTNMEMYWFFTGKLIAPKSLANLLKGYSVGKADRRIAEKHLKIASKVVERGGVISTPSKVAIRWWKAQKKTAKFRKVSLLTV